MNDQTASADRDELIISLTQKLLDSISEGDYDSYCKLCDHSLSCFEPEARGHLVHGMQFHKFYFDNMSHRMAVNTTIAQPHIRFLGDEVAVISYIRLQQRMTSGGLAETGRSEETRIWQLQGGIWKHVHFHRSTPA